MVNGGNSWCWKHRHIDSSTIKCIKRVIKDLSLVEKERIDSYFKSKRYEQEKIQKKKVRKCLKCDVTIVGGHLCKSCKKKNKEEWGYHTEYNIVR